MEMEILETEIVDKMIKTQVDKIVEVAEVTEDVEEETEIDHKGGGQCMLSS